MTLKRVTSIILCILTLVPMFFISISASDLPFDDIKSGSWEYNGVSYMYHHGYMFGTGKNSFSPSATMTRAMFVTVLASMAGVKTDNKQKSEFSDVPENAYYNGAIVWAATNGIVAGISIDKFAPDQQITREQTAVILRKFGMYLDYDVSYEDETLLSLCYDSDTIGKYAVAAARWALNYGLMSNCGDMDFAPRKSLTRAQAAVILSKFDGYKEIPPIVPPVTHRVNFLNWDNKVIFSIIVADGADAKYHGTTPVKAEDANYKYVFSGWNTSFTKVKGDLTVKAVFTSIEKPKPQPKPTPKPTPWTKPEPDIRNDIFGSGLTVNNSTFRMSNDLCVRLNTALSQNGGRTVGFYVVDLQSKMTLGYNAKMSFRPACTVKAGLALYAYKEIEAGRAKFSDIWVYQKKHYVDRSGTIQYSPFGTKYTADDVLYRMINISDNVAYYMAQDYLGYQGYNKLVTSLGVNHTHWGYNTWGYLTPQELGLIWQEIYRYKDQSWYGAKLFNIFLNAQFNFIKQGLYSKYPVAHKSGWNDYSYNDGAIVLAERPYIMVIMTTPGDLNGNQAYLGRIARLLDEYMTEYTAWMKTQK